MALDQSELDAGFGFWGTTKWPADFHNAFYRTMQEANPLGAFDMRWWSAFFPVLRDWSATRTRQAGHRRSDYDERVEALLPQMIDAWHGGCAEYLNHDIADADWARLEPFASLVGRIKLTGSPVFTSKFCHFLLPQVFPVVDTRAMGNPFRSYRDYFEFAKHEWAATPPDTQAALETDLRAAVPAMIPNYPVKTKLIELCLIGRRHPTS
jgi:hypothetical protein